MFRKSLIIASMMICSVGYSANKNYAKLIQNPDASVVIVSPLFETGNGNKGISFTSDLNGVCKLFGFNGSLNSIMTIDTDYYKSTDTVIIDADGMLSGVRAWKNRILHIACDASNVLKTQVNTNAKISKNSDASYTILEPRFGGKRISEESDLDGVCRSFGFSKSVLGSMIFDNSNSASLDTVAIDSNGKMISWNADSDPIHTLICRK